MKSKDTLKWFPAQLPEVRIILGDAVVEVAKQGRPINTRTLLDYIEGNSLTMSRIFAYCRISTLDQTTENQRREIESAGFKIKPQQIIEEHISGSAATSERPG
ncbi:recombinase family protein, partial [Escherichia coli]|uniref:recombinase family protein n=1 Tax=Escherichia coli TaxID=562 RepID=UPI00201F1C49